MYVFINYSQLNLEILKTGFEYICIRSIFETGKENLKYYICQRVNVDCIHFSENGLNGVLNDKGNPKHLLHFSGASFFLTKGLLFIDLTIFILVFVG